MHDDTWRTVALAACAIGQTSFVLLYLTMPWWRTFLGRALFGKALMLMAFLDFTAAGRIFRWSEVDVLYVVLYFAFATGIWFQVLAFVHEKKRNRDDA